MVFAMIFLTVIVGVVPLQLVVGRNSLVRHQTTLPTEDSVQRGSSTVRSREHRELIPLTKVARGGSRGSWQDWMTVS